MLNADHRSRLGRALERFLEEDTSHALRRVAAELSVLPITDDRHRHFGIRLSDGKVVSFNRQEPFDVQLVDLSNAELAVLAHAWTKYPELAALVPVRAGDAIECPACDGSGIIKHGPRPANFSCYCGGLGWLYPGGWERET